MAGNVWSKLSSGFLLHRDYIYIVSLMLGMWAAAGAWRWLSAWFPARWGFFHRPQWTSSCAARLWWVPSQRYMGSRMHCSLRHQAGGTHGFSSWLLFWVWGFSGGCLFVCGFICLLSVFLVNPFCLISPNFLGKFGMWWTRSALGRQQGFSSHSQGSGMICFYFAFFSWLPLSFCKALSDWSEAKTCIK